MVKKLMFISTQINSVLLIFDDQKAFDSRRRGWSEWRIMHPQQRLKRNESFRIPGDGSD